MRRPSNRICSAGRANPKFECPDDARMHQGCHHPLCSRRIQSIVSLSISWSNLAARICSLGFRALRSSDLIHLVMAWNRSPFLYRLCGNTSSRSVHPSPTIATSMAAFLDSACRFNWENTLNNFQNSSCFSWMSLPVSGPRVMFNLAHDGPPRAGIAGHPQA